MRAVERPGNQATFRGMAGTRFGGRFTHLGITYTISGNTLTIIELDFGNPLYRNLRCDKLLHVPTSPTTFHAQRR